MASKIYIALFLNLFCFAILAAAQTPANELNLNNNNNGNAVPAADENKNNQVNPQPMNQDQQNPVIPSQNEQSLSQDDTDIVQPAFPNFFRPPRPTPLFDSIFNGQGLMDHFRRHREMMNQQFEQLEKQAAEGQEVRSFTRNGVTYVRTCTTKRVE